MCHVATSNTSHAKASDLLKWSVVLLATYSNNGVIIAYNERQLSINIGIFVFNIRGKIFTYPAKMKICVIIYFRQVTAWDNIFNLPLPARSTTVYIQCVYTGSWSWTQTSGRKQINRIFLFFCYGWLTWKVCSINGSRRTVDVFLHSNKDHQSPWNNSVSFNATFSLGLPLAFIYRAVCYRKNPSIQVRTSEHYLF